MVHLKWIVHGRNDDRTLEPILDHRLADRAWKIFVSTKSDLFSGSMFISPRVTCCFIDVFPKELMLIHPTSGNQLRGWKILHLYSFTT
jgi:hypothetical protein